jgi:hypothetical protein
MLLRCLGEMPVVLIMFSLAAHGGICKTTSYTGEGPALNGRGGETVRSAGGNAGGAVSAPPPRRCVAGDLSGQPGWLAPPASGPMGLGRGPQVAAAVAAAAAGASVVAQVGRMASSSAGFGRQMQ